MTDRETTLLLSTSAFATATLGGVFALNDLLNPNLRSLAATLLYGWAAVAGVILTLIVLARAYSRLRWLLATWTFFAAAVVMFTVLHIEDLVGGWVLMFTAGPVFIWSTRFWWQRKLRWPRGHCQHCGYNLTGNRSGRCPECSEPVVQVEPNQHVASSIDPSTRRLRLPRARRSTALGVAVFAYAVIFLWGMVASPDYGSSGASTDDSLGRAIMWPLVFVIAYNCATIGYTLLRWRLDFGTGRYCDRCDTDIVIATGGFCPGCGGKIKEPVLSFDDAVEYVFNRPVADRERNEAPWHWKEDADGRDVDWWTPSGQVAAEYMARLFEQPQMLAERYTPAQIVQGLEYLLGYGRRSPWRFAMVGASAETQIRLVRAVLPLYRDLLMPLCANDLDIGPRECGTASPIDNLAFMFWDGGMTFDPYEAARSPDLPHLVDPTFETLTAILRLPSESCQLGALHGLNHLATEHPSRARQIIDHYLAQTDVSEDVRTYAGNARLGRAF